MRTHENAHVIPAGSIRIQEQPPKSTLILTRANHLNDEADKQLLDNKTNENRLLSESERNRKNKIDTNSETSSSMFYPHSTCGSKILLKYIDSSLDSDLPPSLTGLRLTKDDENRIDHNSVNKGVEFVENDSNQMNGTCDADLKRYTRQTAQDKWQEDSAMDESISSVDNNQVS